MSIQETFAQIMCILLKLILYIYNFFNFEETMIPFTIKFDSVRNISCRLIHYVLVLSSIPNSPASGI